MYYMHYYYSIIDIFEYQVIIVLCYSMGNLYKTDRLQ